MINYKTVPQLTSSLSAGSCVALEKEMATHSSVPAWRIPGTGEPGGLPSMKSSSAGKESTCNAGDLASIPGLGRSPGEGNGYPLQYSCLESAMDRGDPIDGSPPGSPVPGILQARTLEWVAISSSNA